MHCLHVCGILLLVVMLILAVASALTSWTQAEVSVGMDFYLDATLWGIKIKTPDGSTSDSWHTILGSDVPICGLGSADSDGLSRIHIAEAGAVLAIVTSLVFFIMAIMYGCGKIRSKLVLLAFAFFDTAFAVMCFAGYSRFYDLCVHDQCLAFVTAMSAIDVKASCKPAEGMFLIWAALGVGLVGFCMLIAVSPAGGPDAAALLQMQQAQMAMMQATLMQQCAVNAGGAQPHAALYAQHPSSQEMTATAHYQAPLLAPAAVATSAVYQQQQLQQQKQPPADPAARLTRFYAHYNPEKLPTVESVLAEYVGFEEQLFEHLVGKYGPEPVAVETRRTAADL